MVSLFIRNVRVYLVTGNWNTEIRVEKSEIELEYERRWQAMSPAEKIARSAAMLAWTREQMAIRIRNAQPGLSDEEVRWHVALQLYERDSDVVRLIQEQLANVSR
jgi:hypothetical protein